MKSVLWFQKHHRHFKGLVGRLLRFRLCTEATEKFPPPTSSPLGRRYLSLPMKWQRFSVACAVLKAMIFCWSLLTSLGTAIGHWAFTDMSFGKHVSSIFSEVISSSNLSAATLNLASLFFFVILAFSFILLFCCALPLWTVCTLDISFKSQRIVCSELQAFHLLSHTSNVLRLFSEVPRACSPIPCLRRFVSYNSVLFWRISSASWVTSWIIRPISLISFSTKGNITGTHCFACLWHLFEENDQGMMGCQNQDTPFYLSVFLVCLFFPSALFSQ